MHHPVTITYPALALDTSGAGSHLAIRLADGRTFYSSIHDTHGHAAFLLPQVEGLCAEADIPLADLKTIVVVTGPGGFTGVRIGLTFARTLRQTTDMHVLGVDAFNARILQEDAVFPCAVALDTRRGDWFIQPYDAHKEKQGAPYIAATPPLDIPALQSMTRPDVAVLFDAASRCSDSLEPVYLRDADTSTPNNPVQYKIVEY